MRTLGHTLKEAREKSGTTLEFVSEVLKIRVKYLEALEAGDYSIFSSPIYIKGFIKNYARFLHLPEEEMLALYRREYQEPKGKRSEIYDQISPVVRTVPFSFKPSYIVAAFTICVIISILAYLFIEYKSFSTPPELDISSPSQNQVENDPSLTITGKTNPGNRVELNGTLLPVINNDGTFSTEVTLHDGQNEFIFTALNSINTSATDKLDVIYDPTTAQATTTPGSGGLSQMDARLVIANNNTLIRLIVDGKTEFQKVLSPGTIENFTAEHTIDILTGAGENTNVSINGINENFSSGTSEKVFTLNQSGTISSN